MNIEIKGPPGELLGDLSVTILKGSGQLDVFFSFSNPTAWFFDFGREDKPVSLEVLTDVPVISIIFSEKAEAYLRINHQRIAFGAGLSIGGTFKLKSILELTARTRTPYHALLAYVRDRARARRTAAAAAAPIAAAAESTAEESEDRA